MIQKAIDRIFTMLLLLGVVLSLGCTLAKISGRGTKPLILNNPTAKVEVISHFTEKKMIAFDYTNAFDVSEILTEKISKSDADAVTNLVITIKSDVSTFCVNMITLGLAQAKVFQVEGDLVKTPEGLGSLFGDSKVLSEVSDLGEELEQYLADLKNEGNTVALPSIVRTRDGFIVVE